MRTPRLYSRANKSWQGRSRGFTLIEVLVALALFSIIAIVFAGGLTTASRAVITAGVRTTAESLARTQMESIKTYVQSGGYKNATSPTWQVTYPRISGIPSGYSICSVNWTTNLPDNCGFDATASIIAYALDHTTSDSGLQKIKLVISHDNKEISTLEGYIRRPGG
jgi:prepilin-type N-terminal cleavage/methylation domain-containing protein